MVRKRHSYGDLIHARPASRLAIKERSIRPDAQWQNEVFNLTSKNADGDLQNNFQMIGTFDLWAGSEDLNIHEEDWIRQMAKEKTLEDLFYDTLKDIYFAEKQILKALPKMARAAQSEEGKAGFLQHRDETQGQIERLEQVFELLGKPVRGKTCEAIQGILSEGEEIMEEYKGTAALDAGLIASAQAVEHYEIARYGTLKTWAQQLGLKDAVSLFDANLQEEIATDQKLTALGEASANPKSVKTAGK